LITGASEINRLFQRSVVLKTRVIECYLSTTVNRKAKPSHACVLQGGIQRGRE